MKKLMCGECKDGERDVPAEFRLIGMRWLDSGRKVPYRRAVCAEHLESVQDEVDVDKIEDLQPAAVG